MPSRRSAATRRRARRHQDQPPPARPGRHRRPVLAAGRLARQELLRPGRGRHQDVRSRPSTACSFRDDALARPSPRVSSAPARARRLGAPPPGDVLPPPGARRRAVPRRSTRRPARCSRPAPPRRALRCRCRGRDFDVEGKLIEPAATVHALFEPTLQHYRTSLTAKSVARHRRARPRSTAISSIAPPHRRHAASPLQVAPLPIVRTVRVDATVKAGSIRPLDDEIRRRMRFRTGIAAAAGADCAGLRARSRKSNRIHDFLHDEGYFDAVATATARPDGTRVDAARRCDAQASRTTIGKTTIVPGPNQLAIRDAEIRARCSSTSDCLPAVNCAVPARPARFTRTRYQQDLQTLAKLFQRRGYSVGAHPVDARRPTPDASFDRRTHTVNPVLTIDQRRHIVRRVRRHRQRGRSRTSSCASS